MTPVQFLRYAYRQFRGLLIFRRRVGVFGHFTVGNARNIRIGRDCGINHGVFILGHNRIEIGDGVVLSAASMLIDSGLETFGFAASIRPKHIESFVVIEDGAWIGAGAIILPGVTVGKKSIVGAGSVVSRDVPAFTIVAGNPARQIGRTDAA